MKSKAHIKSHPLHPILVSFPIAFFTGTLFFDILALIEPGLGIERTAHYLNIAGLVTGLAAANPGIIDYRYTVPPRSSAKKRAVKHGLINVSVVVLFVSALILRINQTTSDMILIVVEVIAIALMLTAGWLGGTLVMRNQIGVDIRYAEAGKWKEVHIETDKTIIAVADSDELKTNQMKLIHINGKRIVIAKGDDGYFAFDDRCTHRGGSLAAGAMICNTVQCPWHGSQFDVKSGNVVAGPANSGIGVYPINIVDGTVYLQL